MQCVPTKRKKSVAILILFLCLIFSFSEKKGNAGTYMFAEGRDPAIVTHPLGYNGSGTTLVITVGVDPTSTNASSMEIPVKNLISVFNNLQVNTLNVDLSNSEVSGSQIDFESVALHEFGHAMGLGHPNLATESGVPSADRNYTKTEVGTNSGYDLDAGSDSVKGSDDDVRGDDINLNWFKTADNDPFTIAATVDSTTYSHDTGDLPGGDNFVANGDRDVANLLGYNSGDFTTESVLQQGSFYGEVQRRLGAEDVAALRYGMAGVDELANTADDYTYWLVYAGLTASADIVIDFDDSRTGFAVTSSSATNFSGTHWRVTSTAIYFNTGYNWYFNSTYEFNDVTTQAVTGIGTTTATGNGNITELGTPNPTAHGVCWSTSTYPTTDDDCTDEGSTSATGAFTTSMTGLTGGETYYVRAYATNTNGTNYGDQVQFTTNTASVPTITTDAVSSITTTTATGGGDVTSDNGHSITARGVCWSESENPTLADSFTNDGAATGTFTSSITGLDPGTTYYVRAYATNSEGTGYGNQVNFTTNSTVPTVTTASITSIGSASASGGGNVTTDGGATVTARGVCWSESENPTLPGDCTSDGTGTGSFTSSITSLDPGTTYYVRAYATNINGTSYGGQVSFETDSVAPTVTTTSVTSITTTTGSSGGNVTDDGGENVTARGVCWSESENPTLADDCTSNGTGTGSFTSSITSLDPGTTYYVRAYATNSIGTNYGNQVDFTTDSTVATVTTTSVSTIAGTTATSGGNVTTDGGATVTARGVCWSTSPTPTTADNTTSDGTGEGSFTSSITGLSPGTPYYVRAYATNINGTSYGSQESFTTTNTYALNITKKGQQGGSITSNPSGIDCGSNCSEDYATGMSVTLTATSTEGNQFLKWSGSCTGTDTTCVLTMNQDHQVNAHFNTGFPWNTYLPSIIGSDE